MASSAVYPSAFSSPQSTPPSSSLSPPQPFTGYQQPPQLAYGWWVDMLPPRGPYLWPCISPANYAITEPVHMKDESGGGDRQTAAVKEGHSASFLSQPPQMCYGWYVSSPPPSAPFFWPCIPSGYTLIPINELKQLMGAQHTQQQQPQRSALPLTTTTRQGNVTLTLPTTNSSLSSSTTPSSTHTPHTVPSDLSAPTPTTSSVSSFYPPSKLHSILPPSLHQPSSNDSLGFLNLSSQPDDTAPPTQVPLPVRSPALEGLANVALPGGGGGGGEFVLDQAGEPGVGMGGEDGEGGEGEARRGKRKRTGKAR